MDMKGKVIVCLLGSIILVTGLPIQSQMYIWTEKGCNATYALTEPVTIFFKTFYGEPFEIWVSRPLFGSKLALQGIGDDSIKSTTIILGEYPGEVSFILIMPCTEIADDGFTNGNYNYNYNATEPLTMCELGRCTIYIEESDDYYYQPPGSGYLISDDGQVNNYAKGLDVSHHNGDIDWKEVKEAGFQFAFIKATEGGDGNHNDGKFQENITDAEEAEFIVGAYHFACPDIDYDGKLIKKDAENIKSNLEKDAHEEATNFFSVAGQYMNEGYLIPALDIENQKNDREIDLDPDQLVFWVDEFVKKLKELTRDKYGIEVEPLIYCPKHYAECKLNEATTYQNSPIKKITEYGLWIVDTKNVYEPDTKIWDTWVFWQYKVEDWKNVPGFKKCDGVDLDRYNGDLNSLKENGIIKAPKPSSTEPSSTEPSSTEPSSTEPSSTEPSSTEPSSTEEPPTDEGGCCNAVLLCCNIGLMLVVFSKKQHRSHW